MKAVLTVIGKDKVGIIAGVSEKLSTLKINILDVSQTIMGDNFTMMMMLDLGTTEINFDKVRLSLNELGEKLGVKISIQREEIFDVMHKI